MTIPYEQVNFPASVLSNSSHVLTLTAALFVSHNKLWGFCADICTLTLWYCRFLGHLYAAEALISLDRISDAITHLNPENVTDVSLGISSNEQDQG